MVAGRYVLLRELGSGGVGSVYLAQDRQTGESLALKKLSRVDAKSVLRFKREFRSLANMQHPNLVRLYDLEREPDGGWFLTMEYVPGTDLVSYLRPEGAPPPDWRNGAERVLSSFRQLACGVAALHGTGMLHRDLKPSNVLVADQRVLVLDFGLVRGIDERDARVTEEGMVSGTPAYMAPEQACAQALNEAADWYAVGVMLYEALSGELPFDGSLLQIMRAKVDSDPMPIAELEPDAPAALAELCMALLRRKPEERPNGAEISARLGGESRLPIARPPELDTTSLTDVQTVVSHIVGRAEPLEQLQIALQDAERGATQAVHVRGVSGAGKSALIEHFLKEVETAGVSLGSSDVLVLRSRCYEREAMPFKALDSIMDALVVHLSRCDDLTVSHLLPADIQALAQLFPVLERVHAVKKLLGMQRVQSQARGYRQRAEAALRELFSHLAHARPLIVWVDDLHWGDLDSVAILRAWLAQDGKAPFLLLLSYRSDEVQTSPALRALLAPGAAESCVTQRNIDIGPLVGTDVRTLCIDRLGMHAKGRDALIERMVAEADGSPFLASQLASLALAKIQRGDSALQALSIEDLVTQIGDLLPEQATSVLAVLAVAGRPMSPKLALRAAGVRSEGRAILHVLRSLNLVRTRDTDTERLIEIYHDRIREHVYGRLSAPRLSAIHHELLRALEHSGRADDDWLHALALGAGDLALALQYGLAAAERAFATLAFERAAELYTRCLELCADSAPERAALWRKLGLVLGYSGRGGHAAEALLESAKLSANVGEAIDLKRMAAAHLVRSGRFEQGDALFEEVMAAASISAPRSEGKLIAAVVWERSRLALRGLGFQRRTAAQVSPDVLAKIDLLEDLRLATLHHDALRSVLFATRSLRLALDAGEPTRIARAFATAATLAATEGTERGAAAARDFFARADLLAKDFATTRERMELNVARAAVSFYEGRTTDVLAPAAEADRDCRELASDAAYFFRFSALSLRVGALSNLDWKLFCQEFQQARQETRATENVHATLMLALNETLYEEITGQSELSVARLDAQRALLPSQRFTLLHVLHLTAVMHAAVVTGKHAWAREVVATCWPTFIRSPLRRTATLRAIAHVAHGRLLLNEYARSGGDAASLGEVMKDIKALHDVSWGHGHRLLARVKYLQGDRLQALALLKESQKLFSARHWAPDALRNEVAIGRATGGEVGERMARAALDELERKFGCHDAERDARTFFPEFMRPIDT